MKAARRDMLTSGVSSFSAFRLSPFQPERLSAPLQLTGRAARNAGSLLLRYELRGRLEDIALPGQTAAPSRRDQLWRTTCFELFAAPAGSPAYWEVNLSPSGDWNVYAFDAYREGMREEQAVTALPCRTERRPDLLMVEFTVPPCGLAAIEQTVELAVSAVIQDKDGQLQHWALRHCGPQPDFHRRESFCLSLP